MIQSTFPVLRFDILGWLELKKFNFLRFNNIYSVFLLWNFLFKIEAEIAAFIENMDKLYKFNKADHKMMNLKNKAIFWINTKTIQSKFLKYKKYFPHLVTQLYTLTTHARWRQFFLGRKKSFWCWFGKMGKHLTWVMLLTVAVMYNSFWALIPSPLAFVLPKGSHQPFSWLLE
jgi:hypothetical protein